MLKNPNSPLSQPPLNRPLVFQPLFFQLLVAIAVLISFHARAQAQNAQLNFQFQVAVQNPNANASDSTTDKPGIYIMNADGSGLKLAATVKDSTWQGWPRWSNDGSQLAFEVQAKGAKPADTKTYKVPIAGGEPTDLGLGRSPNWSPDDKQLLFSVPRANAADTKNGVYIMNADGTGRSWFSNGRNACFSPDGSQIAYINGHDGSDNIYIYDVVAGKSKYMLQEKFQHIYGCSWSPDAKQVCFVGNQEGKPLALTTMDPTGADKTLKVRLSDKIGRNPAWSPSDKILLWLTVDDTPRLHTVDPNSDAAPTLLQPTGGPQPNIDACWSPDGKQIAFSSNPRGS